MLGINEHNMEGTVQFIPSHSLSIVFWLFCFCSVLIHSTLRSSSGICIVESFPTGIYKYLSLFSDHCNLLVASINEAEGGGHVSWMKRLPGCLLHGWWSRQCHRLRNNSLSLLIIVLPPSLPQVQVILRLCLSWDEERPENSWITQLRFQWIIFSLHFEYSYTRTIVGFFDFFHRPPF
jgi:hypothetical protein